MILYWRHVCCYAELRAWLQERFVLIMKNDGFSSFKDGRQAQMDVSEAISLRWRAMVAWKWLQSSLASLKQLSSKSNNEHREKAGPDQSKTMWANAVFFCHVLRIELSDEGQDKPSLGTKEWSCINAMSIVMLSIEHGRKWGPCSWWKIMFFII